MAGAAVEHRPGRRAFLDLHCHTAASFDCLSRPADLVRVAAQRGLTHVAVTDHETIDGALAARDAAPDGLNVIVGQEVRTRSGDLIGLFLERPLGPGMSAADTAAAIREQGGLVGVAHPFDRFRASGGHRAAGEALDELLAAVDYVETWNARVMFGDGNQRAAQMAVERGLPGVAVSDAHTLMEVGVAYTFVDAPVGSAAELRAALSRADIVTGRASRLLRAGMPLAKGVQWLRGKRRIVASPGGPA
jgi:predicted metal-dependent phosphoesterase TrpH